MRTDKPPAHVNFHFLAHIRKLDRHVCEADVLFKKRRRASGSHFPDSLVINYHFLVVAGDAAFGYLESDEPAFDTLRLFDARVLRGR